MQILNLLVVGGEGLPRRPLGEWFDAGGRTHDFVR